MAERARTPQPGGDGTPATYYAPTADFAQRPPSPPFIHIPARPYAIGPLPLEAPTSFEDTDLGSLTAAEVAFITGTAEKPLDAPRENWHYELRRRAQAILDFIFLGPISSARDSEFLVKNGITMVLGVQDSRLPATRLAKIEETAETLGIQVSYVDGSPASLIRTFSEAIKIINQHLIHVYQRGKAQQQQSSSGGMDVDANATSTVKRGKVLVFCETGNDRSAAVVAAYIMAVFHANMFRAAQHVQSTRFCSCFDEETKQKLTTYEGLLQARRQIATQAQEAQAAQTRLVPPMTSGCISVHITTTPIAPATADNPGLSVTGETATAAKSLQMHKRVFSKTVDADDISMLDTTGTGNTDTERFMGRQAFAPFMDQS